MPNPRHIQNCLNAAIMEAFMLGLFTTHVSDPYNKVDITAARYTPLLTHTLRAQLSKMEDHKHPNALAALPSLVLTRIGSSNQSLSGHYGTFETFQILC